MPQVEAARYTIGVFKDVASARSGINALVRHGFPTDALSVAGTASEAVETLLADVCSQAVDRLEIPGIGQLVGAGSLLTDLGGGTSSAPTAGLAAALCRVGFQPHDGQIYEALIQRGGVLVAVRGEVRAADAMSVLHNYGGGNAAIGAWLGRL